MAYQHTNSRGAVYHLHSKEVKLRSGHTQRIYYFAREVGPNAISELPAGFVVVENPRTGLPTLKKA